MGMRRGSAHGLGARTRRLLISALAVALLVTLGASSPSAATSATCAVTNKDTGRTYPRLQSGVDAAKPGAHLVVKGTCHGGTLIDKSLVIEGVKTRQTGTPTLTGDDRTQVVTVKKGVRVKILAVVIRDGKARWGGGVSNRGRLTLRDVVVRANAAARGGGVHNGGTLVLVGSTSIRDNVARHYGAGVWNDLATMTMNDTSTVTKNGAPDSDGFGGLIGGGVWNGYPCPRGTGTLTLNDASSIRGNTAWSGGGVATTCPLTLNDFASIRDNAAKHGGGADIRAKVVLNDSSTISGNTALYEGGGASTCGDGTLTLNATSSIRSNTARRNWGGGVMNGGAVVLNDGSTIIGNTAQYEGGGVYSYDCGGTGALTMTGSSTISGNVSRDGGGGLSYLNDTPLTGVSCGPQTLANVVGNTPDDCRLLNPVGG